MMPLHFPCGGKLNQTARQGLSARIRFASANLEKHFVYTDTVGQYTGLTDKNGKRIFEGDIIRTKKYGKMVGHSNVNDYDVFRVVYVPCMFRLERSNPPRGFNLVDDGLSELEIIGNIYDNPELMDGSSKKG